MEYKVEGIQSEEELKKAQAAAQAQGAGIANYSDWSQILKELEESGVQSTGSYAGDKAKVEEIKVAVQEFIQEVQTQQAAERKQEETKQVKEISETDKNQETKAIAANASADMMANYMKYYHLIS